MRSDKSKFKTSRTQTLWGYATGAVDASTSAAGVGIRAAVDRFQEVLSSNRADFAAEGLLEGTDDPRARADLLRQLQAAGVPLGELREAVEQDRLALLPVEAVLRDGTGHTLADMAAYAELDETILRRRLSALGLGQTDGDATLHGDALEAAAALKELQDAGISDAGIDDICRISGRGALGASRAIREVFSSAFSQPGDNERDLGLRYAAAARRMIPVLEPLIRFTLTMQLLNLVRSDVVGRTELATGSLPNSREIAVCFADLTDFTRLGETLNPEAVGALVRSFDELVQDNTPPGARHVKTVGDAAMLVSEDPHALLEAARRLVAAAETTDGGMPRIHAGIAMGRAVTQQGDWYGRPVNLASRLAESAPPGHIYATEAVREVTGARFEYAGVRRPKGIDEELPVFCLKAAAHDDASPA